MTPETYDALLSEMREFRGILTGFIERQEAFNSKQEAFNERIEKKIDRTQYFLEDSIAQVTHLLLEEQELIRREFSISR